MNLLTQDKNGAPICPICSDPVPTEGEFCSPEHWHHFTVLVQNQEVVTMGDYKDLTKQSWYAKIVAP